MIDSKIHQIHPYTYKREQQNATLSRRYNAIIFEEY